MRRKRLHWQAGRCNDGMRCNAMLPSRGQHPSLRGTLVVVATVVVAMAMAMAMAMAAVAASAVQEVALLRWGGDGV